MDLTTKLYPLGTKFIHKSDPTKAFVEIIGINTDKDSYILKFTDVPSNLIYSFSEFDDLIDRGYYTLAPYISYATTSLGPATTSGISGSTYKVPTEPIIAKRFNSGKPQLSLLPAIACEEEAKVWEFGAKKYGRSNWRSLWGDNTTNVALDSALRHLFAMLDGEMIDKESGLYHAAHARCNLAMILEYLVKKEQK